MAEAGPAAVLLDGVSKTVGRHRILDGVTAHVAPGESVALMGANGAGKSILLDLVCGLTRPTAGRLAILGRPPREAVTRGLLGAMLQTAGLLPELTVEETVDAFAALHRVPRPDLAELDAALPALATRRIGACSGGEKQRVAWALAQLARPRLLVLDEPTAGMDWQARRDFWAQVGAHRRRGCAVLYATHYADEVDGIADRILLLDAGRLVATATPDEVRRRGGHTGATALFDGLAALVDEVSAGDGPRCGGGWRR